jgi:hypothetical protein
MQQPPEKKARGGPSGREFVPLPEVTDAFGPSGAKAQVTVKRVFPLQRTGPQAPCRRVEFMDLDSRYNLTMGMAARARPLPSLRTAPASAPVCLPAARCEVVLTAVFCVVALCPVC